VFEDYINLTGDMHPNAEDVTLGDSSSKHRQNFVQTILSLENIGEDSETWVLNQIESKSVKKSQKKPFPVSLISLKSDT
jgi:hypothetical protein